MWLYIFTILWANVVLELHVYKEYIKITVLHTMKVEGFYMYIYFRLFVVAAQRCDMTEDDCIAFQRCVTSSTL